MHPKHEQTRTEALTKFGSKRECIRYAVYKASGINTTQARKKFGFENISEPIGIPDITHQSPQWWYP